VPFVVKKRVGTDALPDFLCKWIENTALDAYIMGIYFPDSLENHFCFTFFMEASSCNNLKVSKEITIRNKRGLHLRFAGQVAQIAMGFPAVVRLCKQHRCVDARSALSLLTLEATCGCRLTIQGEGDQAPEAVEAISNFIETYSGPHGEAL